uniref:ATP synthase complex subunit 8 n=1 Tax=Halieutaea stellata TaxID=215329 RepID=D3NQD8_9TELE|nr:ATPase subunit 8 [Halieutaea stellata]
MPQLSPGPWFAILLFSWFILLTILVPKVLTHSLVNEPMPNTVKKTKKEAWPWPWQ